MENYILGATREKACWPANMRKENRAEKNVRTATGAKGGERQGRRQVSTFNLAENFLTEKTISPPIRV